MSRKDRPADRRRRRSELGVGMVAGAVFAAGLIGLANAPAARADTDLDPFEDLFATAGVNTWTAGADSSLLSIDPSLAASLDKSIDSFADNIGTGAGADNPFSEAIYNADPTQFTPVLSIDSMGNVAEQLVPLTTAGDLAAGVDFSLFSLGLPNVLALPSEIFTLLFVPWLPLILAGA